MARFVIGDPSFNLLQRKIPRGRQRTGRAMEPGGEKKQKFLLFLGRQLIRGRFNLQKSVHGAENNTPERLVASQTAAFGKTEKLKD